MAAWLSCKRATKREILSLVGLLQHATKVVIPGRTFVSRMYSVAACLKRLSYFTHLTKDFHSDLQRMVAPLCHPLEWAELFDCSLPDHRCFGTLELRCSLWHSMAWSNEWSRRDIMEKELVPIVLSCAVWGSLPSDSRVEFKCDNSSVVYSINKGSSKEPLVMYLLRCLWFFAAYFDIKITASHIPGMLNTAADKLSRNQSREFLQSNPHTSRVPILIPTPLLKIISPQRLDWTSPSFLRHFRRTINRLQMYSH